MQGAEREGGGGLCFDARRGAIAEQERNTPDGRKRHQNVDQSAHDRRGTAEHPSDEIEFKDPDKTPVDTADDQQYQSELIPHHLFPHFVDLQRTEGLALQKAA